ncbi:Fc.00g018540.m01.CDS01 [Cosmosporella sp. VM-42]
MKFFIVTVCIFPLSLACSEDNCLRQVGGNWAGIGVPLSSRIALCNSFLRTTIRPAATTTTTTVSLYTTSLPPSNTISLARRIINTTSLTRDHNETIRPTRVPTYATGHCPSSGQYSSACSCWTAVTPSTTTLPTPTVTMTTTRYFDVACEPAATGVSGADRFPCSAQWGMCSCLKSGEQDVCVRVGAFTGDRGGGGNVTGPCAANKECGVDDECEARHICVYDGSCACGKKRCYRAAPNGCGYQGLPIDDGDDTKRKL